MTEMHGLIDDDLSTLMSDLPTLMGRYEPGMTLDSVITFLDARDEKDGGEMGVLTGLMGSLS